MNYDTKKKFLSTYLHIYNINKSMIHEIILSIQHYK
jgi:hypothetical protein